jgi:S-DNA-T family DNA segregation ATPase FtsK/SpoIIIE
MGKGAVRSQMDVRICLRVRERRDAELILGQGMLAAGWHAHTLDAPGKFLLSAPGLDQPRRARGYLLTDPDVEATARRHAAGRPRLDPLSADAPAVEDVIDAEVVDEATGEPEALLWTALRTAPPEGHPISILMNTTGMGRTWIYDRLQQHADAGRVTQVTRGRWRATNPNPDAGAEP